MFKRLILLLSVLSFVTLYMVTNDWGVVIKTLGYIGISLWLLAAILSGALVSGDRNRANYRFEGSAENYNTKQHLSGIFFSYGLYSVGIGLILFLILKYFFEIDIKLIK